MRPVRVLNFILICTYSKVRIAEARVGFKAANRESFPYIMHIVDEPRKFSPSNVLTYTVYCTLSLVSAFQKIVTDNALMQEMKLPLVYIGA